jgi:hypothetical protein
MKYLKTRPFILALSLVSLTGAMPMAGVLTASAAWADVTVIDTTDTSTDSAPAADDPANTEDVRPASEETCDEVTDAHLRVSRC